MRNPKEKGEAARPAGFAEEVVKPWGAASGSAVNAPTAKRVLPPPKVSTPSTRVRAKVGPGGRLVIPAAFRAAAGMEEGAEVMITLHDEEVRIITPQAGLRRAKKLVRESGALKDYTVDDFIRERRAMWGEEDE